MDSKNMTAKRPHLYRAYYDWFLENDLTPYLVVNATFSEVVVPSEFINDGKIILNISPDALFNYHFQKESISFSATFKGVHENLYIPFSAIEAMYARENGEGIIFEKEDYYESNDFKHHETNVSDKPVRKKPKLSIVT
ncbi:ClpXP protease specificity-enhancing factor [Paraphotobacterium marinum]|nr:ClpXP protease specificity-enhancing factor [Paraphotobacterium marinum]